MLRKKGEKGENVIKSREESELWLRVSVQGHAGEHQGTFSSAPD